MRAYTISLCIVRMALKKPSYPDMLVCALSNNYHPAIDHDGVLIYGSLTIFDLG